MHTLSLTDIWIPVPTYVTDVDNETAAMMIMFHTHIEGIHLYRPADFSLEKWHQSVKVDSGYIKRRVQLYAVADPRRPGMGSICIYHVNMGHQLNFVAQPVTDRSNMKG